MKLYETATDIAKTLSEESITHSDTIKLGAGSLLNVLWNICYQLAKLNGKVEIALIETNSKRNRADFS